MQKTSKAAFSLVELMIVVTIIGVLAVIGMPVYRVFVQKAKQSEAKSALGALYKSEVAFYSEYATYGSLVDQVGFALDGNQTQRQYSTGFFGTDCNTNAAIAPAAATVAGSVLNLTIPAYYSGSSSFLPGRVGVADTRCNGLTVASDGQSYVAASAGMISTAVGASADVWSIGNTQPLANIQSGLK